MSLSADVLEAETLIQQWSRAANVVGPMPEESLAILATTIRDVIAEAHAGASRAALNEVVEDRVGIVLGEGRLTSLAAALRTSRSKCIEAIIRRMTRLGEIAQDPTRRWHATPSRFVRLNPDGKFAAIISCEPTSSLQRRYGIRIEQWGLLRYGCVSDLARGVREDLTLWQSTESWLRIERLPLKKWTNATIGSCIVAARSWDQPVEKIDVFIPAKGRYTWKSIEAISKLADRPFLCRSIVPGSNDKKEYWLGFFRDIAGTARLYRRADLSMDAGLRLALGQRYVAFGRHRLTAIVCQGGFAIPLRDRLPHPERRIMDLGCRDEHGLWRFPTPMRPLVNAVMNSLGHEVTDILAEDGKDV